VLSKGLCGRRSCLMTERVVEDDSLIVMCIHCGFSRVTSVELLEGGCYKVAVFCRVPDFVMFW